MERSPILIRACGAAWPPLRDDSSRDQGDALRA